MKNGLKIIDMRCRPPFRGFLNQGFPFGLYDVAFGELFRKMTGTMATPTLILGEKATPGSAEEKRAMALFVKEMDQAGIDYAVAPYRAAWGDAVNNRPKTNNQDLVDLMADYPNRFIGVAGISPHYSTTQECVEEIEKFCVQGPLKGIIMEPYIDRPNYFMNDEENVYPILEKCQEAHLPVLLTFGSLPGFPEEQIPALQQAAAAFPEVNFVCCHGGYPHLEKMAHLAFIMPNIYLSPDMYFINTHVRQIYLDAANYTLRDKLLFGSAYPGVPLEFCVNYYLNSGLREDVLPDVLYRTAAKLFGMDIR